jgi:hypothetical protein
MSHKDQSISIAAAHSGVLDGQQRLALALTAFGVLGLFVTIPMESIPGRIPWLLACLLLMSVGAAIYMRRSYLSRPAGIRNDGVWHSGLSARGAAAWVLAIVLTGFYVLLYFFPAQLGLGMDGEANRGIVALFDPLSRALSGNAASQWFVYGALYTFAILAMGLKFILKHRHSRYQIIRTCSVMFFQLGFAFLIPELLQRLNYPYHNFANMWPLNYYFFDEWSVRGLLNSGGFGLFILFSGVAMIFLVSPLLTYFFGKRWFCSWVCGCGGLAETAGDPFRQLSDKSLRAWKVERWLIHSVLVFAIVMTAAVVWSYIGDGSGFFVTRGMLTGLLALVLGGLAVVALVRPGMLGARGCAGHIGLGGRHRMDRRQVAALLHGSLSAARVVRLPHRGHLQRGDRRGLLSADGVARVVPIRMPHGGDPRTAAALLLALPDHHERRSVHQLRQLQHVLRDGHRCAQLCPAWREHRARQLRGLRPLRQRLPAGCSEAGERQAERPVEQCTAEHRSNGSEVGVVMAFCVLIPRGSSVHVRSWGPGRLHGQQPTTPFNQHHAHRTPPLRPPFCA